MTKKQTYTKYQFKHPNAEKIAQSSLEMPQKTRVDRLKREIKALQSSLLLLDCNDGTSTIERDYQAGQTAADLKDQIKALKKTVRIQA